MFKWYVYSRIFISISLFLSLFLAACSTVPQSSQPTLNATAFFKNALLTATYAVSKVTKTSLPPQPSKTAAPTLTKIPPTSSVPRTPPALPSVFITDMLNKLDTPHAYIQDVCQYLKMKWDPNNSPPGTVVMPIMFHSVTGDATTSHEFQITHETLIQLLDNLKSQGFEAISAEQLSNFLYKNAKIPKRSVILIVDDRHYESYFRTHFEPKLKEFGWTMVNAWISTPLSTEDLWAGNIKLQSEGWVDHQAHGVFHNIAIDNWDPTTTITTDIYGTITSEEYIRKELTGARDIITQRFGKAPIAYIWPGGGFSQLAVKIARETGYQLGFTVNPRGPLMFNWIPLEDEKDPARPSYIAEGKVNDPLMVLPRYWDVDASAQIDVVRTISKQSAAYAQQSQQVELDYYNIVCKNITGEIPTSKP